jgi:hypothetical protein
MEHPHLLLRLLLLLHQFLYLKKQVEHIDPHLLLRHKSLLNL